MAEPTGAPWGPTRALGRAVVVCSVLLVVAVLTGRYDLVALAIPFAIGTGVSLARRPAGIPVVEVATVEPRFPEGGEVNAAITLDNAEPRRLDVVVVRLRSASWVRLDGHGGGPYALTVGSGESAEIGLTGRAVRWGRQALGPTTVHAVACDGLMVSDTLLAPELWLRVFPINEPFAASEAMPKAAGLVGGHRSRRLGEGGEMAGVRPFGPGDRLRRIDWRVSLRSRQLHVVSTLSDRDAEVLLLVDALHEAGRSGGVDGDSSVLDTTVRAAAGIAEHYLGRGDRVAMLEYGGNELRRVRPGSGHRQYLTILEWLLDVAPASTAVEQQPELLSAALVSPNALVIGLTPLLDRRSAALLAQLVRGGRSVLAVDTLGEHLAQRAMERTGGASGKGAAMATVASRLWQLERANLIGQLGEHGVPVVAWAGAGSLDLVLRDVSRLAAAPRAVRR